MALQARSTAASMDSVTGMKAGQLAGDLIAGEALDAAAACYIKGSDGKVYMSNGTANDEAASFMGFTPCAYALGAAVTLFNVQAVFEYATGMTPGAPFFVAATAGRLDTAATTGGLRAIAEAVTATRIRCIRATDLA